MAKRCNWCTDNPLYIEYHDYEWGVPLHDDQKLFEFLILESMQAGLSWLTILKKRENFRYAFTQFNPEKIARYDEQKIMQLMNDVTIIRNHAKIIATVNNAKMFLKICEQFGCFDHYIWQFTDGETIQHAWKKMSDVPAKTKESEAMAKDLKSRGFSFLGPTTCYAHMQATGMVNDHLTECFRHPQLLGRV